MAELDHVVLELAKMKVIINSSNIMLWSDSTIMLSWINTFKPLKVFVANRVAQIIDFTSPIIPSARCHLRKKGPLTVVELSNAKTTWILHTQKHAFHNDLDKLSKNQQLSKQSQLKKLHPFIDSSGLIRVGGRLSQSNLSDSMMFPILLPSKSRLIRLLFEYEHKHLLHIGPHIQGTFWPIRGRIIVKSVVHNCLIWYKTNPALRAPLMASLTRARGTMERPFARIGVDFYGLTQIRGHSKVTARSSLLKAILRYLFVLLPGLYT
ncbi:uncharacterized protein LOC113557973 [Rhopalosiphum maidis]|uniref:uncharacterized protein LOC113557973 n=1 Tax=Rhopalosiphum maidis TaxID=43146 RepID=UPI000F00BA9A|nr:uncharacterized protein LOC113557973 [Rhopalosiphum maidis]